MKFNCGFKWVWFLPLAIGGLAFVLIPLFRTHEPPAVPPAPLPREVPAKTGEAPAPAAPAPATPPPADPLLRRWQNSIRLHDAKGVMDAQSTFLARQEEYRDPLMKMAREDSDPRIRAFCVAVLGRMQSPPPEGFFIERLGEGSEHPRTSSLNALERIGTAACLPAADRLSTADPDEGVRAAAVRAAKAVRSR